MARSAKNFSKIGLKSGRKNSQSRKEGNGKKEMKEREGKREISFFNN